jgi:PEGA domain
MKTYLTMILSLSILLITACAPEKARKPKGQLELDSVPQGADVILNSKVKLKKQTPVNVKPGPGVYLVKMSKEGYQPVWRYVKIRDNKKTKLNLTLPPVRGSVLITSEPAGGKVMMNGKNQGLTPLVLTNLKPGEYSAQVEHMNRAPRVIKWAITDIRPKKVSASLESDIGKLVLKTEPSRARVYINGKVSGISPFRTELQEGRHKVKVTLTGFAEAKASVDIIRDKTTTKTIKLMRLPGTFEFRSNPKGALVYINQRTYGRTPLTVADLQAGQYKIRVERDGFDSISRDAYITAGRVNVVEFKMKRNTGGIDLIVNPPGVTVYVNGKKRGMTVQGESKNLSKVIHLRNLPAGRYQIMLAHKRMMPPTKKKYITVQKAKITRPKPINVWIANAVLKPKDEPQKIILLLEENKDNIIYSPEPGVRITLDRSKIELVRPLAEEDQ